MKYIVLIGDGMADRPVPALGGKTPLQAAFTPNMDKLAREGVVGTASTIPKGMTAGSDVANLSILGYDPVEFFTGRAPLEAASMGIELGDDDVAFRCNLVTLSFNADKTRARMEDHSAGQITSEESRVLIEHLDAELGGGDITFYPGVSYRHLMLWRGGLASVDCTPPHDILGKDISDYLPLGEGCEALQDLQRKSVSILEAHEINKKRHEDGKRQANSIWLWGQGRKPSIPLFRDKYGIEGALVSAVDLTKGLGTCAGFEILQVPGVTGYLDTNYVGKAEASLRALERVDLAYIHVEAPDEAGHAGSAADKIRAIEDFDALVVGTVLRGLRSSEDYKILLMPDHATPIELRTHTSEPVPFALYSSSGTGGTGGGPSGVEAFDEDIASAKGAITIEHGHKLMGYLIKGFN